MCIGILREILMMMKFGGGNKFANGKTCGLIRSFYGTGTQNFTTYK